MTVSAFNHIRTEENPEHAPVAAWAETGLCYAALAGGHPQLPDANMGTADAKALAAKRAELEIPNRGGGILSFDDVSDSSRPMEWTMTFDGKGKLLKAAHTGAELMAVNTVHPTRVEQAAKTVSPSQAVQAAKTIPPVPQEVLQHPAAIPAPELRSAPIPPTQEGKQAAQPGP
jgi:hypothetical protein